MKTLPTLAQGSSRGPVYTSAGRAMAVSCLRDDGYPVLVERLYCIRETLNVQAFVGERANKLFGAALPLVRRGESASIVVTSATYSLRDKSFLRGLLRLVGMLLNVLPKP